MEAPEYVFSAVVLQQSFVSEKSGVMVTTDLELRERGWITVAVNEGIGGVVEGQAAESLRVELTSGEIRYLAPATASHCRVLAAEGGLRTIRATGAHALLSDDEIDQLIREARSDSRARGLRHGTVGVMLGRRCGVTSHADSYPARPRAAGQSRCGA